MEVMDVARDVRIAWESAREALGSRTEGDWTVTAAPTTWSCRDVLDHVADGMCGYATSLSNALSGRPRLPRNGDPLATPAELFDIVGQFVGLFSAVVQSSQPERRAFHPSGMADRNGFTAMACDEILVHTHDVASAFGIEYTAPAALAERVRDRLFPWAPTDRDPWETLLWANDRRDLPGLPRLGSDWWWHSPPLREWSGERTHRGRSPGPTAGRSSAAAGPPSSSGNRTP